MLHLLDSLPAWVAHSEHQEVWAGPAVHRRRAACFYLEPRIRLKLFCYTRAMGQKDPKWHAGGNN
jgi:hypothetical protein